MGLRLVSDGCFDKAAGIQMHQVMGQLIGLQGEDQREILRTALIRSFATSDPLKFTAKKIALGLSSLHELGIKFDSLPVPDLDPSHYSIRYSDGEERFFERFDFEREWNNAGYGRIGFGVDPFSLTAFARIHGAYESLAEVVHLPTGERVSDYLGILRWNDQVALWCLRPVGPVDGFDWIHVESFVSDFEIEKWGGAPTVSELPAGFDSGFLMRIDCDEHILSGRPLAELYWRHQVPFSLAVKTGQKLGAEEIQFFQEIRQHGGSVLPHSHTHKSDWGFPSGELATEWGDCVNALSAAGIPRSELDFVVSPFHQNSRGAVRELAQRGVKAFLSGIICNDPEYLCARPGVVPFQRDEIITLSHQCMLHGDCYRRNGSSIEVEKSAFRLALKTKKFFGYLDHPFSAYSYGWLSEEERLNVHQDFLNYLLSHSNQWRPNLVEALAFYRKRSALRIVKTGPSAFECRLEGVELEQIPSSEKLVLRFAGKDQVFQ